jgi:hypothetical protein
LAMRMGVPKMASISSRLPHSQSASIDGLMRAHSPAFSVDLQDPLDACKMVREARDCKYRESRRKSFFHASRQVSPSSLYKKIKKLERRCGPSFWIIRWKH